MRLLGDAWKIIIEQKNLVAAYVALATIINLSQRLFDVLLINVLGRDITPLINLLDIAQRVLISMAFAALSAIIFARLGKEIDRPLWKCSDDKDALQRFFMPWFILFLSFMLLVRIHIVANQQDIGDAVTMLEFFVMFVYIFLIPIGACVMYWGKLDFDEIPEILSPIAKQLPLVAIVLLMAFLQYFVGSLIFPALATEDLRQNPFVFLPIDIVLSVVDCWIFITMWLILIIHRDYDYDRDVDF